MNAPISSPELGRGENAGPVNCKPCLEKQPHSQPCRPPPMDATPKSSTVSTSLISKHPGQTQQILCPFASKMATQFFCFLSGPSLLQTRGSLPPHQEGLDFLRPRKWGPTLGSSRDDCWGWGLLWGPLHSPSESSSRSNPKQDSDTHLILFFTSILLKCKVNN